MGARKRTGGDVGEVEGVRLGDLFPGLSARQGDGDAAVAGASDGDASGPRRANWQGWPPPEQAYRLHLRGLGCRAIARELGIDPKTAAKWVRQVAKEQAPLVAEKRDELVRRSVERFEAIQAAAWAEWDQRGEAQLLNSALAAEREVARLRGLYEAADREAGLGGIAITITRRVAGPARIVDAEAADADSGLPDE